jgi:hypothetical protein
LKGLERLRPDQMALINDEERRSPSAQIDRSRSLAFHLLFVLAGSQAGTEGSGFQADITRILFKLGFGEGQPTLIFK